MLTRNIRLLIALAAMLLLVFLLSPHASPLPDGLERFALNEGFAHAEKTVWEAPLSGYTLQGIRSGRSLAALIGTSLAFLSVLGMGTIFKKQRKKP